MGERQRTSGSGNEAVGDVLLNWIVLLLSSSPFEGAAEAGGRQCSGSQQNAKLDTVEDHSTDHPQGPSELTTLRHAPA
jgi:hypothetical protein